MVAFYGAEEDYVHWWWRGKGRGSTLHVVSLTKDLHGVSPQGCTSWGQHQGLGLLQTSSNWFDIRCCSLDWFLFLPLWLKQVREIA